MNIQLTELTDLVTQALQHQGYTNNEIPVIRDILLYAQLRGNNQGVVKLIGRGIPKNTEAKPVKVVKETKLSAVLDGGQNMGMIVLKQAMDMALTKAAEHGFGIAGTHNTSSSTGALGYYATEIAKKGFIGMVFAGSPETVATYGSYEPIFGTNPIAIGVPSTEDPIVLDMATAAMAYYGLIEAKTAGRKIPAGIAYDKNGNLTQDPAQAMDGAIMSFDRSYKSAGLALMVEMFTGPLVGAAFVGIGETSNWGNLIFVIDPELLTDKETFRQNITALATKVKGTKKLPGVKEIFLPGERGNRLTKERNTTGTITIEDNLYSALKKAAGN